MNPWIRTTPTRLAIVACSTAPLWACGHAATAPDWPVRVQLRLVNATTEAVFIRAEGDESLYPGIADLAPNDSACTTINAFAQAVLVEVHSVSDPATIYGSGWVYALRSAGWHAVVGTNGVVMTRSATCS
jgi:hypothetical protein